MFRQGEIPELIDDQQINPGHDIEHFVQAAGDLSGCQFLRQLLGGVEQHALAGLRGLQPQADGKMCFADPRSSDEQYILCRVHELQRGQLPDQLLVDLRLEGEVKLLQALDLREARTLGLRID